MMAIISATLATEPQSRFTLIYGNRNSHSMMFRQALADLKDRYPQRLQVIHLFSWGSRWTAIFRYRGALTATNCASSLTICWISAVSTRAFICGPAAMMDEAEATLRELGVAEKSIYFERFNTQAAMWKRAAGVQAEGRTVTIRQDGRDIGLSPSAPKTTASWMPHWRQGADLPFARKGGVCATCNVVLRRSGDGRQLHLEADELAAGYVLSCQSLPTSGDVVVDFDARGR